MIVPDLNLLLYAVHKESPAHTRASKWLRQLLNSDESVGLPWMVTLGFLRLTTNGRIFSVPMSVDAALEIVDGWQRHPNVSNIEPSENHWVIVRALLTEAGAAANLTTDAHLAAICMERGATLHTADADFGRFKGLRWINPIGK